MTSLFDDEQLLLALLSAEAATTAPATKINEQPPRSIATSSHVVRAPAPVRLLPNPPITRPVMPAKPTRQPQPVPPSPPVSRVGDDDDDAALLLKVMEAGATPTSPATAPPPPPPQVSPVVQSTQPLVSKSQSITIREQSGDRIGGLHLLQPTADLVRVQQSINDGTCAMIPFVRLLGKSQPLGLWMTFGVLVRKSVIQDGKVVVWTLADLAGNTIALLCEGTMATSALAWEKASVVALFEPSVQRSTDRVGTALHVTTDRQHVKLGISRDFGLCKGTTSRGDRCTIAVNAALAGGFCTTHLHQAIASAASRRQSLSSSSSMSLKLVGKKPESNMSTGKFVAADSYVSVPRAAPSEGARPAAQEPLRDLSESELARVQQTLQDKVNKGKAPLSQGMRQVGRVLGVNVPTLTADDQHRVLNKLASRAVATEAATQPQLGRGCHDEAPVDLSHPGKVYTAQDFLQSLKRRGVPLAEVVKESQASVKKPRLAVITALSTVPAAGAAPAVIAASRQPDGKSLSAFQAAFGAAPRAGGFTADAVANLKSKHASVLDVEEEQRTLKTVQHLADLEEVAERKALVQQLTVSVFHCSECQIVCERRPTLCFDENHPVHKVEAIKKFFKCTKCGHKTGVITSRPAYFGACRDCTGRSWEPTSCYNTELKVDVPQLLPRGEEHAFSLRFG